MSLDYPFTFNVIKFMAIFCRMGAFFVSLPIFTGNAVPRKFQVFILLVMSVCVFPAVPSDWGSSVFLAGHVGVLPLAMVILMEVLLGAMLGLVVHLYLTAFALAGYQFDQNMGFMMAKTIDPMTNSSSSVLQSLLNQVFIVVFFVSNFHQDVVRIAARSFETLGPGSLVLSSSLGENLLRLPGEVLMLGFMLSLPIFAIMTFVNISMGLITRVGKEFPVMMLAFPIRIGLGLMILTALSGTIVYYSRVISERILEWFIFIVA